MTPRLFDGPHLVALAVTLLAEGGGMALLAALWRDSRGRVLRCVAVAVGLNLVSHTVFWIGLPLLPEGWPGGLLGAEAAVAVAEAVPYRLLCSFRWWQALSASVLLNLLSLVLGIEIWRLLP